METSLVETSLPLDGLKVVAPERHIDERGYFSESFNQKTFEAFGITDHFVQDNHAFSKQAGTLRGLHFQRPPHAQAKLIRCTIGRINDVVLDIRQGSKTFGQHYTIELSAENGKQLYVPIGFAHGYCTLERNCEVQYKVSAYYAPGHDTGVSPLDPALGIRWGREELILSPKDQELPNFFDLTSPFHIDS